MSIIYAKFVCDATQESGDGQTVQLSAVTSGSEENDKFFNFTPFGQLNMGTVHGQLFEEGKEYYLNFSLAKEESNDGRSPQADGTEEDQGAESTDGSSEAEEGQG